MSMKINTTLPSPTELKEEYPLSEKLAELKKKRDQEIRDIFTGKSDKFAVIIGPVSYTHLVLKNLDFQIEKGEVVTLIGPSGGGKTTLLRSLNWLNVPDAGRVTIDGVTIEAGKENKQQIRALREKTSMVFQHYNLWKSKTALENITEGPVSYTHLFSILREVRSLWDMNFLLMSMCLYQDRIQRIWWKKH